MNKKIGVFDSGVGGLTVLKSLYEKMPNENYIYIGDNKFCPYGDKTKEELYTIAKRIIKYFESRNVKLIVVACNTISSTVLEDLKKETNIPIIGVIDATVDLFLSQNIDETLVIGTNRKISSNIYERKIKEKNNNIKVISLNTPLLVPLIESNKDTSIVLNDYLKEYKNVKSIILGCTHYKLVEDEVKNILSCPIINSSDGITMNVYSFLKENNLFNNNGDLTIYTTGDIDSFKVILDKLFKNISVNKVEL